MSIEEDKDGHWSCLQCIIKDSFIKLGRDPEKCYVKTSNMYCYHVCHKFTDCSSVLHSEIYFYLRSLKS